MRPAYASRIAHAYASRWSTDGEQKTDLRRSAYRQQQSCSYVTRTHGGDAVSDIQPDPYIDHIAAQHGSEYQPLTITVHGRPAPQGSKRHVGNGVMIESSKAVKPWREDVKQAGLEAMGWGERPCLDGPLRVSMVFTFGRPASHYGTGRNAGRLKPSAPLAP